MDLTTQDICKVAGKEICRRLNENYPEDGVARMYIHSDEDGFNMVEIYQKYNELIGIEVRKTSDVYIWSVGEIFDSEEEATISLADPKCFDKVLEFYDNIRDGVLELSFTNKYGEGDVDAKSTDHRHYGPGRVVPR